MNPWILGISSIKQINNLVIPQFLTTTHFKLLIHMKISCTEFYYLSFITLNIRLAAHKIAKQATFKPVKIPTAYHMRLNEILLYKKSLINNIRTYIKKGELPIKWVLYLDHENMRMLINLMKSCSNYIIYFNQAVMDT